MPEKMDYEQTIIRMAIAGATNGEIARAVGLTAKTVAAITDANRNLIRVKQYEARGLRPDGTPWPHREEKNNGTI